MIASNDQRKKRVQKENGCLKDIKQPFLYYTN